jgi:hypothetical protein
MLRRDGIKWGSPDYLKKVEAVEQPPPPPEPVVAKVKPKSVQDQLSNEPPKRKSRYQRNQ